MAKKRHIGIVIFAICSAISARIARFEPEPHVPTAAEERWGTHHVERKDTIELLHGMRFYIYGIGLLGLAIVAEDYLNERWRKKKDQKIVARQLVGQEKAKNPDSFR